MSPRGLAPTSIFTGVVAAASGILLVFRAEHSSFDGGDPVLFGFVLTAAGVLLAAVGIGTWARRASPPRVFLAAMFIGVATAAIAKYGHINIHDWTAILYFVALAGGAGAIFLLVAAASRL